MTETAPQTTVKIFSDREYDAVEIPNSDLPRIRRFAEKARDQYVPDWTLQEVCLSNIRDLVVRMKSPAGTSDASVGSNAALPVMLLASMTDPMFREDADNFILFEAWPTGHACTVYRADMVAHFRRDVESARQHFALTGGQIPVPPPTRSPGETSH
jgi:hypothetical protein